MGYASPNEAKAKILQRSPNKACRMGYASPNKAKAKILQRSPNKARRMGYAKPNKTAQFPCPSYGNHTGPKHGQNNTLSKDRPNTAKNYTVSENRPNMAKNYKDKTGPYKAEITLPRTRQTHGQTSQHRYGPHQTKRSH